jgi:hypothetical protein
MQEQVLVRWDGLPPHLATWEADQELHQLYYLESAWGHAALQDRENVTTKTQARGVSWKRARDVRRRRIATKAFSIQEDKATGGRLPAT